MDEDRTGSSVDAGRHPGKQSLGDRKVVWKVLADMLKVVAEDPGNSVTAVEVVTRILTGQDPALSPLGSWNQDGIGRWIRGHMNGVPEDGGAESAVEYALGHLVLHNLDAIKAIERGANPKEVGLRLRRLVNNWTSLLLGIPAHLTQEAEAAGSD